MWWIEVMYKRDGTVFRACWLLLLRIPHISRFVVYTEAFLGLDWNGTATIMYHFSIVHSLFRIICTHQRYATAPSTLLTPRKPTHPSSAS